MPSCIYNKLFYSVVDLNYYAYVLIMEKHIHLSRPSCTVSIISKMRSYWAGL